MHLLPENYKIQKQLQVEQCAVSDHRHLFEFLDVQETNSSLSLLCQI